LLALFIHDDAKGDLEDLWNSCPQAAAKIAVTLQELKGNPDLMDRLTQEDYGAYGTADFSIKKWIEQWYQDRNLWRLKIWDLEGDGLQYRIVYAFVPLKKHHHILAIVPREEFNYEASHPITQRIRLAYENL